MMIGRKQKRSATPRRRRGAQGWLGTEIELLMHERERLLLAAGAAASLFTALNIRDLPADARRSLRALGASLASLPDETLSDAMQSLWGGRTTGGPAH
jgi:hypothetical protein